jgi:hypothetical protein
MNMAPSGVILSEAHSRVILSEAKDLLSLPSKADPSLRSG